MKRNTRDLVFAGVLVAIAIVLPMAFHQFNLGRAFLPLHLPVLLAGLWLGSTYGLLVGLLSPILCSLITSMPPMAIAWLMMFELGAYGFFAGFFTKIFGKDIKGFIIALILSMIFGRIVYGILKWILVSSQGDSYTLSMFIAGTVTSAIPGIILQIVLLPILAKLLNSQFPVKNENI